MIDVSKYEKVAEVRNGNLHWVGGRDISAVYLLQFRADTYIGSAEYVYLRIKSHLKNLLSGGHVEKVQRVFDEEKGFDVYIIENGIDESLLFNKEVLYIDKLKPTLNTMRSTGNTGSIREIIEHKIAVAGLTKKEVAERMGIIPNNINVMLNKPSWPTLKRLADAIGITVSTLVSGDEENQEKPYIVCPYCHQPIELNPAKAKKQEENTSEK